MKKALLSALLICLCLGAVALGEAQEYLLWDIPYGITTEECEALILEKTGIALAEPPYSRNKVMLESALDQGLELFGKPAIINVMSIDGYPYALRLIAPYYEGPCFNADQSAKAQAIQSALEDYSVFLQSMEEEFGAPTGGRLSLVDLSMPDDLRQRVPEMYNYPFTEGGAFDSDAVLRAFEGARQGHVSTAFGNVRLLLAFNSLEQTDYANVTIVVSYEPMPGKDSSEYAERTSFVGATSGDYGSGLGD